MKKIGADSFGYISIEGRKKACEKAVLPFCTICFTGSKKEILGKKEDLEGR